MVFYHPPKTTDRSMEPSLFLSVLPFSCILISLPYYVVSVNHANTQEFVGDVAVNCGSKWNSTALDGREWIAESASATISGKSTSSVARSFLGADHVPYMTSRISTSPFHFTFQVTPGQKFVRFHFYPASYRGFENFFDLFTVKVGPFTLLDHFSATLASRHMGVKYFVKEFCLNVEEHGKLRITFSSSKNKESMNHMVYAFVNGIEIVSMQVGLYYTPEGDLGASVVGQRNRFYEIDNTTALEMVQRLNIGGNFISPVEDFGMFRRWIADAGYFLESGESLMNYLAPKLAYTYVPLLIAPPKVYQTSWKTTKTLGENQLYSFTWKLPINLGFGYLVRLHFCDLDAAMTDGEQKDFSILINNHVAEKHADVLRWSDGTEFPVYKDYVAMMKGDKEGSESHLFIVIQSLNGLALELFKGLEIFKLSNLENCLATPIPTSTKNAAAIWSLNIRTSFSLFSLSNVIGTCLTIIILILSTTVYHLRIIWEENAYYENDTASAAVEPSGRRFSLADIRSATDNFSDAFVIGRGGFGNVFKGLLSGYPEIVAIKRLSSFSRQGAREFWTEIEVLSKVRHFNLVPLLGFCTEDEEMILIYEYIPGGTLADNLYKFVRKEKDCALLSWEQRLRICIGAARGLEYLHTGSETGIIHRDVKDTNILLGENCIPKIADFGLSKLEELTQSKRYISTHIKGSRGYLDPYYCSTNNVTRKSDVYSFGIVMLVVLSGRPALDTKNLGDHESLLACFQDCVLRGEFDKIVDPRISVGMSPESLKEFLRCVDNCLQQGPKARPTMAQLVGSLELVLQLQEKPLVSASGASGDVAVEAPLAQPFVLETIQSGEMSQVLDVTFEEADVSPPVYDVTSKKASPSGEVTNHGRKPLRIWPWKINLSKELSRTSSILKALRTGLPGNPREFSFKELKKATNSFDVRRKLGQGGFGAVYRGFFEDVKLEIAVKWFLRESIKGQDDFLAELTIINRLRHKHLVRLLGWCHKNEKLLLVYEYMPKGSLDLHLFSGEDKPPLSWNQRYKIVSGVASALHYLHNDYDESVIHRDLKASNIMLDDDFNARLGDFGLARVLENEKTSYAEAEGVPGTFGYIAPECFHTGRATKQSDVYSFGAVLLEVVCGQRPGTKVNKFNTLVDWVWFLHRDDILLHAVDVRLGDDYAPEEAVRLLLLGLACSHPIASERPNTQAIMQIISGSVPVPYVPPFKPPFVWPALMPSGTESSITNATSVINISQFEPDWRRAKST